MSKLLALDTSATACSVALSIDGHVEEIHKLAPREHTRLVLPMVDRLLSGAGLALGQLDAIALGVGPGSFTGLRICAGVVQGLAFGADVPVVAVSSLGAIAQGFFRETPDALEGLALVCMDARMGEMYFGAYTYKGLEARLLGAEQLLAPEQLDLADMKRQGRALYGLGSGWCYRESMPGASAMIIRGPQMDILPRARDVAVLGLLGLERGETLSAAQVEPIYLRDEVAWQKASR